VSFTREDWARLRGSTPLTLGDADLATLRGINDRLSLDDVTQVYLPLSRLLNLCRFLGKPADKVPYVVGVAGSVARSTWTPTRPTCASGTSSASSPCGTRCSSAPTRERAHLVLRKGRAHAVEGVRLRKL